MRDGAETVVIGLGNVILSDDGLGVHALRRLRQRHAVHEEVELVEGGTAGLLLLPHLADARRAIVIDAIDAGAPPGTLVRLPGTDWMNPFRVRVTPHDVAFEDLAAAARLSGAWPEQLVVHGAQPAVVAVGTELSAPLAACLDVLVDAVAAELAAWNPRSIHARN